MSDTELDTGLLIVLMTSFVKTHVVGENNPKLPDLVLDVDGCDPTERNTRRSDDVS